MIKVSDLIFNTIASYGIDTVFTVSGGGCMHLIDSLGRNKNIGYVCNHHEQACAMAAESYARIKNKPGCILVTTGPGGTNTLTGVLCAYQDSIPMIVISGQAPTDQLSKNTGCRQIGQQEFNIVDTVKTMTKYAVTVTNKRDILYHLEKAIYLAESGRPGPVWLDIPLDIQSSEVCLSTLKKFTRPKKTKKSILYHYKRSQFISLLKNSHKPIVVVGGGIRVSDTVDKLKKFLDITKIPVMSGPHSAVDVINTDYEFYMGRFGILGQKTSNHIIQESDLIVSLGSRLNPKMTGYDQKQFAPNAKKIIIDIDKNEIKKLKFTNKYSWNIDLNSFFDYIIPKIQYTNIESWHNYTKTKRATENLVLDKHKNLTKYVSTYVFANSLESYLSKNSIIVTSDGTAHVIPLKTINLKYNQRLFSNEGTAPMGYGLPAAIGAYYGSKSPIICIEGDGSIMMNLQELELLSYNKLPIKLFIINNQGYLSIKLTQNSFFKGHLVGSDISSGVSLPSFAKIASAFNIPYTSIKNNNELDIVLKNVFNNNNTEIIELFCDPNELHEPKVSAKGIDSNGKIIPGNLIDIK